MRTFKDPITQKNKYILAIKQMVADNRESLEVDHVDLSNDEGDQNIIYFLPETPTQVLACLDRATTSVVFGNLV